jgi:hypothetical protein
VGTSIPGLRHGTLNPVLRFVPGLDEYDDPNKGYYAQITYKVNDGELDSLTTKTITIHVTPVNDIPRPIIDTKFTVTEQGDNGVVGAIHIVTPEETPVIFKLRGYDPDGDSFDLVLRWCNPNGGDLYLNTTSGAQWLNCSQISENPQDLGEGMFTLIISNTQTHALWNYKYQRVKTLTNTCILFVQAQFGLSHIFLLLILGVIHCKF